MHKRSRGYEAEQIVIDIYKQAGWELIHQNFTIPGGEIDCVFQNTTTLLFIEVKDVSSLDDIHNYITLAKRRHIKKTMMHYIWKYPSSLIMRCDIVFIKHKKIHTVIENCVDF